MHTLVTWVGVVAELSCGVGMEVVMSCSFVKVVDGEKVLLSEDESVERFGDAPSGFLSWTNMDGLLNNVVRGYLVLAGRSGVPTTGEIVAAVEDLIADCEREGSGKAALTERRWLDRYRDLSEDGWGLTFSDLEDQKWWLDDVSVKWGKAREDGDEGLENVYRAWVDLMLIAFAYPVTGETLRDSALYESGDVELAGEFLPPVDLVEIFTGVDAGVVSEVWGRLDRANRISVLNGAAAGLWLAVAYGESGSAEDPLAGVPEVAGAALVDAAMVDRDKVLKLAGEFGVAIPDGMEDPFAELR